jgi:hypothetical protein
MKNLVGGMGSVFAARAGQTTGNEYFAHATCLAVERSDE